MAGVAAECSICERHSLGIFVGVRLRYAEQRILPRSITFGNSLSARDAWSGRRSFHIAVACGFMAIDARGRCGRFRAWQPGTESRTETLQSLSADLDALPEARKQLRRAPSMRSQPALISRCTGRDGCVEWPERCSEKIVLPFEALRRFAAAADFFRSDAIFSFVAGGLLVGTC